MMAGIVDNSTARAAVDKIGAIERRGGGFYASDQDVVCRYFGGQVCDIRLKERCPQILYPVHDHTV